MAPESKCGCGHNGSNFFQNYVLNICYSKMPHVNKTVDSLCLHRACAPGKMTHRIHLHKLVIITLKLIILITTTKSYRELYEPLTGRSGMVCSRRAGVDFMRHAGNLCTKPRHAPPPHSWPDGMCRIVSSRGASA